MSNDCEAGMSPTVTGHVTAPVFGDGVPFDIEMDLGVPTPPASFDWSEDCITWDSGYQIEQQLCDTDINPMGPSAGDDGNPCAGQGGGPDDPGFEDPDAWIEDALLSAEASEHLKAAGVCGMIRVGPVDIYDSSESRLEVALLDLDGDGLQDLVESTWQGLSPVIRWWRNLGGGFSNDLCADGQCGGIAELGGGLHVASSAIESHSGYVSWSRTARADLKVVADLNQDGVVDLANVDEGYVAWGLHNAAGRLVSISNSRGGETSFEWAAASEMWPAGDPAGTWDEHNNVPQHVVTAVESWDLVSGAAVRTEHEYQERVCEGGTPVGFHEHIATNLQPNLSLDPVTGAFAVSRYQASGDIVWYERSRASTSYELTATMRSQFARRSSPTSTTGSWTSSGRFPAWARATWRPAGTRISTIPAASNAQRRAMRFHAVGS